MSKIVSLALTLRQLWYFNGLIMYLNESFVYTSSNAERFVVLGSGGL